MGFEMSWLSVGIGRTPLWAQSVGQPYFWLPEQASEFAGEADWVFNFILYVSIFFFVLIVALMSLFVVRYRRRPGREMSDPSPSHNTALEVVWTSIPVLIVMFIFYFGFVAFMDMRTPPREAYEISVVAKKWSWTFKYPNGYVDDRLHVPAGEPVRLVMTSDDVIHSLFIPEFRVKQDLVPGRFTRLWFRAREPGEYSLFCAEYCGSGHADMLSKVIVHSRADFDIWLTTAGDFLKGLPPARAGEELFARRGCAQCHSVDGRAGTGPTVKGIWGETHRFTDGSTAVVDENYVRESILEPGVRVREGFTNQMPTFKGVLNDEQIGFIIEYIKSLQ
jgi:cytochrome c oxidase subunit 2